MWNKLLKIKKITKVNKLLLYTNQRKNLILKSNIIKNVPHMEKDVNNIFFLTLKGMTKY